MGGSEGQTTTNYRFRKVLDFFRSDIFIIIVVVLVILFLTIAVICCIHRRRQNQRLLTQRLTQIVVVRAGSVNQSGRPSYTLRIETDQNHATKLVGMITGNPDRSHSVPVLPRQRLSVSKQDLKEAGCSSSPSSHIASWRNRPERAPDQDDLDDLLSPGQASLPIFLPRDSSSPDLPSPTISTSLKGSQSAPEISVNSANQLLTSS